MKNFLIGLVIIAVLGLLGWLYVSHSPKAAYDSSSIGTTSASHETTNPNADNSSGTDADSNSNEQSFTLADVSGHNNALSCYSAINGSVYDLTNWINQHPGGRDAILSLCGKDGSSAFNAQHGGQSRPENELAGFKIGALTQ